MVTLTQDEFIFDAIIGFLAFAVLFFGIMIIVRANYILKLRWKKRVREEFQRLVPHYIMAEDKEEIRGIFREIKSLANTEEAASILLDELTVVRANFYGSTADRAKELFDEMKLYTIGLRNLYSPVWHRKKHGLLQLSVMNYQEAYPKILKMINHRDKDIRRKARIAVIRIKGKQGLLDLRNVKGVVSKWALISITSILDSEYGKLTSEEVRLLREADNKYLRTIADHFQQKIMVE